jgi:uncharacterized protein YndB with AHSA1/START domain
MNRTPKSRKQTSPAESAADSEIVISRLLDAPRPRVWAAMTDLNAIERWWGPDGFTNKTQEFSFKAGGIWRHTMVGPDGIEYPNLTRFEEIVAPERVVYTNGGGRVGAKGVSFRATWTLREVGDQTEVTIRMVFATPGARDHVVKEYGAIEGGHQTLARLARHLTEAPAFELVLERVIDASRARVFEAWAKPEQLQRWFAPNPYRLRVERMDFRPGGAFRMAMLAPSGAEHEFSGVYSEIVPPARLVWIGEFATGPAEQIRTEVNFEEQGTATRVPVRQTFSVLTPETEPVTKGAKEGWTMTLDQLQAFCS